MTYFPPELWRNIFSFDRTYKEVFDGVSTQFNKIPPCNCGAHIPNNVNSWVAPKEHVDFLISGQQGNIFRIYMCRSCGIIETYSFPKSSYSIRYID